MTQTLIWDLESESVPKIHENTTRKFEICSLTHITQNVSHDCKRILRQIAPKDSRDQEIHHHNNNNPGPSRFQRVPNGC